MAEEVDAQIQTRFLDAVRQNLTEEVRNLIHNDKVDPNFILGRRTPITVAATGGNELILEILIDGGCDLYAPDPKDYNWLKLPIHTAASIGHSNFVLKLLEHGVGVNIGDQENRTALHWASTYGHHEMCKTLMENGAKVNATQVDGLTPLHSAIPLNHLDVCRLLINHGADVNMSDRDGWTPLHTAVGCRKIRIVEMLVKAGAHLDAITHDKENLLHIAVCESSPDIVEYLIDQRVRMNDKNVYGNTPFHLSISYNQFPNGKLLVKSGAETETTDNGKQSPLYLAAIRGYKSFITLLLNNNYNFSKEKWIHNGKFPENLSKHSFLCEMLKEKAKNPETLKKLCIFKVRYFLQFDTEEKLELLQIPQYLKDCITQTGLLIDYAEEL